MSCREVFDIEYTIAKPTSFPQEEILRLKDTVWLDGAGSICTPDAEHLEHHPATITSPCCDNHPDIALTLVSDKTANDERFRFGWLCSECGHAYFDYLNPFPRRNRNFFTLTDKPDFRCRVCHHCEFAQSDEGLDAECLTCGTVFRLAPTPVPKP